MVTATSASGSDSTRYPSPVTPARGTSPASGRWLVVRASLLGGGGITCDPPPGREMLVGPRHTFADLADAIDTAFARWDLSHLHVFELADGRRIGFPDEELEYEDHERLRVTKLVGLGDTFTYTFDLGDNWRHSCFAEEGFDPAREWGEEPDAVIPIFGWGTIPDRYGRLDDDRPPDMPPFRRAP